MGKRRWQSCLLVVRRRAVGAGILTIAIAGCGGSDSPTTPSQPNTPNTSAVTITGTVTDALSNATIPGVAISVEGVGDTTSAADGRFSFQTTAPEFTRRVTLRSASTVERVTGIRGSGGAAAISLIPNTLNLTAFNEMARSDSGATHRWTEAPRLVVERRVLTFTNLAADQYVASSMLLTDQELADLIADLAGAVPSVSGGNHAAFAEVVIETAAEGAAVNVSRPRAIHVARYDGLRTAITFVGYGRWSWNGLGELFRSIVMLDHGYEQSGTPFRRALRTHELGHAYGYNHVTARSSFMHPTPTIDPNGDDQDAARLVFLRPPLNMAPDTDPAAFSTNRVLATTETWRGAP